MLPAMRCPIRTEETCDLHATGIVAQSVNRSSILHALPRRISGEYVQFLGEQNIVLGHDENGRPPMIEACQR
jgi:hypothetical protein